MEGADARAVPRRSWPHGSWLPRSWPRPSWLAPLARQLSPARLRLISGLWLFLYVLTHLLNHALGLVSLATAEEGRLLFLAFWRAPLVEASLLLAVLVHAALGLRGLWHWRTLRLSPVAIGQLGLGLAIPALLTTHVLATGWLHRCCGLDDSYAYMLHNVWPEGAARQILMTLVIWVHGVLGLHYWLRLRPAYRRLRSWLLVAATMLPLLALTGFASAGRDMAAWRSVDPVAWAELARVQAWPEPAERQRMLAAPDAWIVRGFFTTVLLVLLVRALDGYRRRRQLIRLRYPGGREVSVPRGTSVLEASNLNGIPHASVCGGHGRCSTCRVRVGAGAERLPPPAPAERRVLTRIRAPADVRLACQIRPTASLAVTPLMPAAATAQDMLRPMNPALGIEREIVVLFCDLRGFTRLSEGRLPYDTVFLLNRYFAAMGEVVEAAGGEIDKFIGDGVMALFGVAQPPELAVPSALTAARAMALALEVLNHELAVELREPLRIAIGLHAGQAILGEMGHGRARALTVIGDAVNVASRLETLCKESGCQLLASDSVARLAQGALDDYPRRELDLRGRSGRIGVRQVADARALRLPWAETEVPAAGPSSTGWWSRLTRARAWGAKSGTGSGSPSSRSDSAA
ncbi:MAG: adenylate/guanylate cyclase domain-containing protein [Geminicoccaceae bacterium]